MSMGVNRAVAIAAAIDETELRSSYERAVSHGAANTLCTPEEESEHGTLRLLTLATLRLPDLYLYGYCWRRLTRTLRSSRCRRSSPRALGRSRRARCGSRTARWRLTPTTSATSRACGLSGRWRTLARSYQAILSVRSGPLVDQPRRCAIALTRAIAATAAEAMLVPGELADGLACLLALYLVATTLG